MCQCCVCRGCTLCPAVWVVVSTSRWGGQRESEFVLPSDVFGMWSCLRAASEQQG